jgi:hypothetical protein
MPDNKKVGMGGNTDKQTSKTGARDGGQVGQQGKNATSSNQQSNAGNFNRSDKGNVANTNTNTSKNSQKNMDTDDDIG